MSDDTKRFQGALADASDGTERAKRLSRNATGEAWELKEVLKIVALAISLAQELNEKQNQR